jgi:hypothetical protein
MDTAAAETAAHSPQDAQRAVYEDASLGNGESAVLAAENANELQSASFAGTLLTKGDQPG